MNNLREIQITKQFQGMRIDQVLSHFLHSRSKACDLIKKGFVQVNKNKNIKPSYKVQDGDLIVFEEFEEEDKPSLKPYDFPISIIYEDSSILVVDKPAGLVVHPSHGHSHDTLVNALSHKLNLSVGSHIQRPGLVHRLDKEVSGLLVLSKTHQAHYFLTNQFAKRTIKRKYWAICFEPLKYHKGKIETFITRNPYDRKKFMASALDGKKSITLFQVLKESSKGIALVEFELLTGRTHQVRVHSLEISEGIIGDKVYARLKTIRHSRLEKSTILKIEELNRVALHAVHLSFIHPETNKQVQFKSSFPEKLRQIIEEV